MSSHPQQSSTLTVASLFTEFARTLDTKDWEAYAADGELVLPWGDPIPQSDLVDVAQATLGGFSLTQHIITNHYVHMAGDRGSASAYLQATHVYSPEQEKENWVVGGKYDVEVQLRNGTILFSRVTLGLMWPTGPGPEISGR